MPEPRSILITGASSGIGEALARLYAGDGVTLFLSARDRARLESVAAACRSLGADAREVAIDVTDRVSMHDWIAAADRVRPLDLVIANAGISGGTAGGIETDTQVRRIFAVNLDGMLNTVHPALEVMLPRGRGQIAIMSSLAGFLPLPGAPAYTASKAAVRHYGEALRPTAARSGLKVSVICPGFVESRITATNPFPMPLLMPADRAARIIRHGLSRNRARIAFPWPAYLASWLTGAVLPPSLTLPLLGRMPAKPSASGP